LRVRSVEFVKSASGAGGHPAVGPPEVAFVGRSNVGKSSLLNRLVGRKSLARVSRTPGRTQLVNYFMVNGELFFVDLPGYGFAKVPREIRATWDAMMQTYLDRRDRIALAVQLVDARRPATPIDRETAEWLAAAGLPTLVVLTKFDKLKASERRRALKEAESLPAGDDVTRVGCSAVTGLGVQELWTAIDRAAERYRAAARGEVS